MHSQSGRVPAPTRRVLGLLGLLGAAAVVAAAVLGWPRDTQLSIVSDPPGATIRIDGRIVGVTPLDGYTLAPGSHRVRLHDDVHEPRVQQVTLARGEHRRLAIRLPRGTATLRALSNPRGAWVELDGERLEGVTPIEVDVPSGQHRLRMGMAERRSVTETITVVSDTHRDLVLSLPRIPHGSLFLDVAPPEAQVEVLDAPIEYQPGVRLPVGEHRIRVSHPGFESRIRRVEVGHGRNAFRVDLPRATGRLALEVSPASASVRVRYPGEYRWRPYEPDMKVAVGDVEVVARAMDHRTTHRVIDVDSKGARARIELEPIRIEPGTTFRDPFADGSQGPRMIVVPAGRFRLGRPDGPRSQRPSREVILTEPFAMSVREVTVAQWRRFQRARGASGGASAASGPGEARAVSGDAAARARKREARDEARDTRLPITDVSWEEANAYAEWVSEMSGAHYRLPTEAEWEYAARGGNEGMWFFAETPEEICDYANVADRTAAQRYRRWQVVACEDGHVRLAPVGTLAPNPFGLYDVYGNAAEWVDGCWSLGYADAPRDGGPIGDPETCRMHVYRGGSWDSLPAEANSTHRRAASDPNDDRGFRLLRVL